MPLYTALHRNASGTLATPLPPLGPSDVWLIPSPTEYHNEFAWEQGLVQVGLLAALVRTWATP